MNKLSTGQIVAKVVRDIPAGSYVNLGIGMPVLALEHWTTEDDVIIHSENGILGMRQLDPGEEQLGNLTNAAKLPVGITAGAAFFHHADSFAMMRGGHIDYSILGAYEVSSQGDIANWSLDQEGVAPAVGGAMDLVVGARNVYVVMEHTTKQGRSRLVEHCSLPLTGAGAVSRVYTDLATLEVSPSGFSVIELTAGVTRGYLESVTAAPLDFSKIEVSEVAMEWKVLK
ncbi:CoA-transferase [Paeniglutamicibacter sp. MACA_103]|uniref:CoA-transferase n=1 Tax=Paeniglutamicibacter sp. MACA_103 TaxID=3377337 RepID=UPI0038946677